MVSPNLYNMLLYRSFHGRRDRWEVAEHDYDKLAGAFGRMPLVIHLGDFLQLKPTGGSGLSLLSNLRELSTKSDVQIPSEHQMGMKLFCKTPLRFELLETNRFKDQGLRELMAFMRDPGKTIPASVKANWENMQLFDNDPLLREQRFQDGHILAIYWDTVARCMMQRATRDAKALNQVL